MSRELFLGTRKGLFVVEGDGRGWRITRAALLGHSVTMLLPQRDGALIAAVEHGHYGVKIQRSMDQGRSWEEQPVPRYPTQPEDEPDLDPIQHTPVPWDLKRIWALEEGPVERPGELWCGTIPGGLFRSVDGGKTWDIVESLWRHPDRKKWFGGGADHPGIHSILIDPRDSNTIRLGVSCGGVWASFDGGGSWECYGEGMRAAYVPPDQAYDPQIQDPHCVVQCPASPEHLWIQHHNGIFRSTDGGLHWSELEPELQSSFGFAVAVHPEDPGLAWFVPGVRDDARYPPDGAVTVSRTRDGGSNFETLRSGLPQSHAYDLVYRHGLAISGSGDQLAFGTTTGNIWISENQGDSWSQLSATLPPIYCVRFR